jgi:2',3'-cyclic-nucleotide 2'-phosphodiesterase (5'-nucleotidase family)
MNRRVWTGLLLSLLLAGGLALSQAPTTLVVLHTNDIHGQVLPRDGVGGLAELATLIRRERPDLLLDGGDMFTGTMLSDEFFGKPIIEVMTRLGYTAAALGNHEFDYGVPELINRLKEAQFPVLSANVAGVPGVQPYTIVTVKGVRIAIIGFTTEELTNVTHPKNLKTVTLSGIVDSMRTVLPKVLPLSDMVILVTHVTFEEQLQLSRTFPEVRLIVSGHPHESRATRAGEALIVETGRGLQNLGKVQIRLRGKTIDSMTSELIPIRNVAKDPEIQALLAPYERQVATRASVQVGETTANLPRSSVQESPLNNLIADALREQAGTQIALQNIDGVRAPLARGPITYGDVFAALPFQNTIVKMTLTGAEIKQLLGRDALAVSGLRVSWDMTRTNRLVSVTLDSRQPLEDRTRYTVAVNDFMAAGGDGLVELMRGESIEDTGILLRDALVSYLKTRPVVSGITDGRVTIRSN